MVMTVVVVVLCAELSITGGATVTQLCWLGSACEPVAWPCTVVVGAALMPSEVSPVCELLTSGIVRGAGLAR